MSNQRNTWFYQTCRVIVKRFFKTIYRFHYIGYENIPSTGAVVLACNHIHNFDPFLVASPTTRFVQFMAKEELFRFKPIGALISQLGAFPVRRGANDKRAMKMALDITKNGGALMVFPEGTRSKTGHIGKGLPGVAFIARKAQSVIVPIAVIGPYRIGRNVTVRVGQPFRPAPDDTNETLLDDLMRRITDLYNMGPLQ